MKKFEYDKSKRIDYKKGDRVRCKKFYNSTFYKFYFGSEYEIMNVFDEVQIIQIKTDHVLICTFNIIEFNDYFYSKQEIRQLKLNKLNKIKN